MILFTSASLLLLAFLRLRCFLGSRLLWFFIRIVAALFLGSFRLFGWGRFFGFFSYLFGFRHGSLFFRRSYWFLRRFFGCWGFCFGTGIRGLGYRGVTTDGSFGCRGRTFRR